MNNDLAEHAYKAYGNSVGWKTDNGLELLKFNDLPERIKAAWRAAVSAILDCVR